MDFNGFHASWFHSAQIPPPIKKERSGKMNRELLLKINDKLASLSKGQKRIAAFILEHYDKAAFMTAAKLGQTVGVSESTVVRFAAEIGYDGYPMLQRALQEMIRNKLTSVQRLQLANEQMEMNDVLDTVLNQDIDRIRRTLDETSREDFQKAVSALVKAQSIYIMGAKSASILANFLAFYFQIIFKDVKLVEVSSSSEMYEQMLRLSKQDVIIGISFPRYSKRTVEAFRYASDNGATVIAITDSMESPLAETADYTLLARSDMASFVDSLVAPLSLVNALIVAIGIQMGGQLSQTFEKLEGIWEEYNVYEKVKS